MVRITDHEAEVLKGIFQRHEKEAEEMPKSAVEDIIEGIKGTILPTIEEVLKKSRSHEEAIAELRKKALCRDSESCSWLIDNIPALKTSEHTSPREYLECPECGPEVRREAVRDKRVREEVFKSRTPEEFREFVKGLSDEELEIVKEALSSKYTIKPKSPEKSAF